MSIVKFNDKNRLEAVNTQRPATAERSGKAGQRAVANNSAPATTDTVSVSERANTIKELVARAQDLPDVRQERIEALREKIQSGEYQPGAGDIADAILKDEARK